MGAAASATYELDLAGARGLVQAGLAAARATDDDWALAWALFLIAFGTPGRSDDFDAEHLIDVCAEGADLDFPTADTGVGRALVGLRELCTAAG